MLPTDARYCASSMKHPIESCADHRKLWLSQVGNCGCLKSGSVQRSLAPPFIDSNAPGDFKNYAYSLQNTAKFISSRKRALLTDNQAREIFKLKESCRRLKADDSHGFAARSTQICKLYGISPKAVRDIWNKRTWKHATASLWTETDMQEIEDFNKSSKTKRSEIREMKSHHTTNLLCHTQTIAQPPPAIDAQILPDLLDGSAGSTAWSNVLSDGNRNTRLDDPNDCEPVLLEDRSDTSPSDIVYPLHSDTDQVVSYASATRPWQQHSLIFQDWDKKFPSSLNHSDTFSHNEGFDFEFCKEDNSHTNILEIPTGARWENGLPSCAQASDRLPECFAVQAYGFQ